jgi:uncharacterized protein with GYD domain
MPTYVSLFQWTEQGIKDAKNTVNRADQARQAITKMGGTLDALYWTQGAYDIVAIASWPDEETAQAFLITIGQQGNIRSETLRAFTAEDMKRILTKVP